jgi:hypothetical protein
MNYPISLFIFIIVLFLYIHVNHQYKKSEDLEIYEFEYTDINTLQETCDVKQPIVFHFAPLIGKYAPINLEVLRAVEKEDGNTLNIKDVHDYYYTTVSKNNSIVPVKVPLSFQKVVQLIHAETTTPHFFSENNHEFIEETGIDTVMTKIGNRFLRPSCSVNQTFDLMTASKGIGLPMRFHTQTRKYVYVSSGRVAVKMAPFKYAKKLDFNKESLTSPMNCWKPQSQYVPYINKVRFLEFDLLEGYMLYIPPYWIYSIFYEENDTCLLEYNYQTAMNMVAHPDGVVRCFKSALQVLVDVVDSFGSGGGSVSIGNIFNNENDEMKENERIAGANTCQTVDKGWGRILLFGSAQPTQKYEAKGGFTGGYAPNRGNQGFPTDDRVFRSATKENEKITYTITETQHTTDNTITETQHTTDNTDIDTYITDNNSDKPYDLSAIIGVASSSSPSALSSILSSLPLPPA